VRKPEPTAGDHPRREKRTDAEYEKHGSAAPAVSERAVTSARPEARPLTNYHRSRIPAFGYLEVEF